MMNRNYLSGATKRKIKKEVLLQKKKMKESILKFTVPARQNGENNIENINISEDTEESVENKKRYVKTSEELIEENEDKFKKSDLKKNTENDNGLTVSDEMEINKQLSTSHFAEINDNFNNSDEQQTVADTIFDPDPAKWSVITDAMVEHFIYKPPSQNIELLSETGKVIAGNKRFLTEGNFYRIKKNSEKVPREWLVLSESNKCLFCWICKLFSNNSTRLSTCGFNDWKHVVARLSEHENSYIHRDTILKFSTRLKISHRIDSSIVNQYRNEVHYWRSVLERVVAAVKFLSSRGMAFFGDDETIGSTHNGNFLGCLELIAKFDPFLARHLEKYGNQGSGYTNYMSSTSINAFIELMATKVMNVIVKEIIEAKYFSIVVDSTPDITHLDQLCFVLRYLSSDFSPVERFIKFIPIYGHGAEYLTNVVMETMEEIGLDLQNCRGQSYDNASNMAGKYSGLQARIKNINPLAEFVPCSAHSLNLVGVSAVESSTTVINFFCLLQELYNFFSASTNRWQTLNENLSASKHPLNLKNRSTTRWCADANATRALRKNFSSIVNTLHQLSNSGDQTATTKNEAKALHKKFVKFETVVNTVVWDTVLNKLNQASKILQNSMGNLGQVSPLYDSLIQFIQSVRDSFENEAREISPESTSYETTRKKSVPKSRLLDDSGVLEVNLDPRHKFITTSHYVLCDALISHLTNRKIPYENLLRKFSCLINLKGNTSLRNEARYLLECYPTDLEEDFLDELQQFSAVVEKGQTLLEMLKTLKELNLSSAFANVETALRIFLTIPISNCSGERSFSLLKRLKSPLRSYLQQNKLSQLSLLCFNSDITEKIDYNDIIDSFAENKIRKKPLKM